MARVALPGELITADIFNAEIRSPINSQIQTRSAYATFSDSVDSPIINSPGWSVLQVSNNGVPNLVGTLINLYKPTIVAARLSMTVEVATGVGILFQIDSAAPNNRRLALGNGNTGIVVNPNSNFIMGIEYTTILGEYPTGTHQFYVYYKYLVGTTGAVIKTTYPVHLQIFPL